MMLFQKRLASTNDILLVINNYFPKKRDISQLVEEDKLVKKSLSYDDVYSCESMSRNGNNDIQKQPPGDRFWIFKCDLFQNEYQ